jgi:hypothetical protein
VIKDALHVEVLSVALAHAVEAALILVLRIEPAEKTGVAMAALDKDRGREILGPLDDR